MKMTLSKGYNEDRMEFYFHPVLRLLWAVVPEFNKIKVLND